MKAQAQPARAVERWVLDTNAVLDWLVFDDPHMRVPGAWLRAGRAQWLHSAPMLDELADVLGRDSVTRRVAQEAQGLREHVFGAARHCGVLLPAAARCAWNCGDPDDQLFIDLAVQAGASLLLTRDKQLLALAAHAAGAGLRITRPAQLRLGALPAAADDATRQSARCPPGSTGSTAAGPW